MEATPGAQAQLNEHGRRIGSLEATRGEQWERINKHGETLAVHAASLDTQSGDISEIKDDVKSMKRAMWSAAVAFGIGGLGIVGVLLNLALSGAP